MWKRIVAQALLIVTGTAGVAAAPGYGRLSGVVVDPAGIPQMGATISVLAESARDSATLQLLSNDRGVFSNDRLLPGLYSVRVTLAGFLPSIQRHIRVDANLTTVLKIELGSMFSSLDQLRRKPAQQTEADDWAWVLRTSAATRSVLRWTEGEAMLGAEKSRSEVAAARTPHARMELTAGSRRPGSVSNIADAPSSAIVYDQRVGARGKLLFAGQAGYERAASAGFASVWLPSGELGAGSETTLVMRQSNLGPSGQPFRGVRMEHVNQFAVGDRFAVNYGAEYILVGLGRSTSSLRPSGQIQYHLAPQWTASFTVASRPWAHAHGQRNALQSTLEELDAFPTIMVRNGRPVLEGGWHNELDVERKLGGNASVAASVFSDRSRHTALFGRGGSADPDLFQDFFSHAFAYDGGESSSMGTRVAYRQKLSDGTEVVLLYALAGALSPEEAAEAVTLRDMLESRYRHSVAARVSTRVPKLGTQVSTSYKWLSGTVVSRQDAFGEVAYQVDPGLNLMVRQPLPGKFEAQADFRNLLAQGYVPVSTKDGQVVLVPAFRTIRGGFSFQF